MMKNITLKRAIRLMPVPLCCVCLTLSSCDSDDTDGTLSYGEVTVSAPIVQWQNGRSSHTRASIAADFYTNNPVTTQQPAVIGVWGYTRSTQTTDEGTATVTYPWITSNSSEDNEMNNVPFTYESAGDKHYHRGQVNLSDNATSTGAFPWPTGDCYFYAYAPYLGTAALLPVAADTEEEAAATPGVSFDPATETFSFIGLPAIDTVDYVMAKKVVTHNRATAGSIVKFEDDFTFSHRNACIQLAFALDSRYAQVRYIDITSVRVTMPDATSPFALLPAGYEALDADHRWMLGDRTALTGMHTSGKYHAYGHLYVSQQLCADAALSLSVTYDVYDLTGTCTRRDATAASTVAWGSDVTTTNAASGQTQLTAGYYYNVLINIVPDYLYVMSDSDEGDSDATMIISK